jgi:membrane protease YdiL (CAAX protease family)
VAVTLAWLILAPLTVIYTLVAWHNVWATFALYHLGVCLVLPCLVTVVIQRRPWTEHWRRLGLIPRPRPAAIREGLFWGLLLGGGSVATLLLGREVWLGKQQIGPALASWGVAPGQLVQLSIFMLLCNGLAEELFWRGYIHERLAGWSDRRRAIGLVAACYTSYHVVTLAVLVRDLGSVGLFAVVVWGAGCFWGWLRDRWNSVWPAALSHTGATAGYLVVTWLEIAD